MARKIVFRVANFDRTYENYRSREIDRCAFVCVPNKQDGAGLHAVLRSKNGAASYGIFHLILGALSRQRRPRQGLMTDDGTLMGRPWTVYGMASRWMLKPSDVQKALAILSSPTVGWVEKVPTDHRPSTDAVPTKYPEQKGTEQKEGNGTERRERKRKELPLASGTATGDNLTPKATEAERAQALDSYSTVCALKGKTHSAGELAKFESDLIRIERLCRMAGLDTGQFIRGAATKFRAKGMKDWFIPVLLEDARRAVQDADTREHLAIKAEYAKTPRESALPQ